MASPHEEIANNEKPDTRPGEERQRNQTLENKAFRRLYIPILPAAVKGFDEG